MSKQHPIIAITGSSGAGTSTVRVAMEHIFRRDGINAAIVEGDSFHRYDREEMQRQVDLALQEGRNFSHFGPEGNLFDRLESLFMEYSEREPGCGAIISMIKRKPIATARSPAFLRPDLVTAWQRPVVLRGTAWRGHHR